MKKLTTEEFVKKAKKVHENKYDYSLVVYTGILNKIKIICKKHGIFEQVAANHIRGCGCQQCLTDKKKKKYSKTIKDFILKSNKIHNNKYNYSLAEYKNNKTKIKIICPIHGVFEQFAGTHMQGNGCFKCRNPYKNKTKDLFEKFIKLSNKIHSNKYDYSLVEYKFSYKKVKIICPKHGEFEQTPNAHKKGAGCPVCKESKGEKTIRNFFENNGINLIPQKTFEECKNIVKLPFDFYLSDYNICIEFNGEQHYCSFRFFGGEEKYKLRIKNDYIKQTFCTNHNIPLLIFFKKYNKSKEIMFVDLYNNIPKQIIKLLKTYFRQCSLMEYECFKNKYKYGNLILNQKIGAN